MARGGKRPGTGGSRPGAGRKKGAATARTREIADRAASDGGVLPLEVMTEQVRRKYAAARKAEADGKAGEAEDNYSAAFDAAVQTAPYHHAKLSAVTVGGGEQPVEVLVRRVGRAASVKDLLP